MDCVKRSGYLNFAVTEKKGEIWVDDELWRDINNVIHPDISNEMLFSFYALKPRQNDRHFPDDFFKCIFLNENV